MKRWYNGFDLGFNARMRGGIRAFGGVNIERSLNDTCVAAVSDPNRSLYCDQSESGIPWQKQFKAHGRLSAAVVRHLGQRGAAEPERLRHRHRGAGLRRLHRRHRLRSSERPRHVLAGHADDALCGQLHRPVHARTRSCCRRWPRRPRRLSVPLVAPETEYTPRINQLDLSVSKRFEFGSVQRPAEARRVQRAELGRLHGGRDVAVRRARPTCSRRWCCRAASSASAPTCAGRLTTRATEARKPEAQKETLWSSVFVILCFLAAFLPVVADILGSESHVRAHHAACC